MIPHSNTEAVRKAVLAELFGPNIRSVWEASVRGVQLPRHPTKELSAKKIKSLSAKYFSIPQEHLSYYPAVPEAILNAPEINTEHTETGDPLEQRVEHFVRMTREHLQASVVSIEHQIQERLYIN